jgi:hypothetical protein
VVSDLGRNAWDGIDAGLVSASGGMSHATFNAFIANGILAQTSVGTSPLFLIELGNVVLFLIFRHGGEIPRFSNKLSLPTKVNY